MPPQAITIDDVHTFFIEVVDGDEDALRRVEESSAGVEMSASGLVFSLPALHALLDPQGRLEYGDFRHLIYDSTLNRDLRALGAEVVPFDSSGEVDSSRYCLRRREITNFNLPEE